MPVTKTVGITLSKPVEEYSDTELKALIYDINDAHVQLQEVATKAKSLIDSKKKQAEAELAKSQKEPQKAEVTPSQEAKVETTTVTTA